MEYMTYKQGKLFVPDEEGRKIGEKAFLSYGIGISGYDEHPYLVFLEDLKKIMYSTPLIYIRYVPIDNTAKAKRTLTGGLKIKRIVSGLSMYEQQEEVKPTSTFSREEYKKIRQFLV
ncbi:hypothetical protein DRN69_01545 [Candidatus Pacearchaeota archaeon]|nr:MAG: hypothetical protein DRN69_01545 [Candidatus Pacearchaeota archaeon]